MHFFAKFIFVVLFLGAALSFMPPCDLAINHPKEWKNASVGCMLKFIPDTKERDNFTMFGVDSEMPSMSIMNALRCTYVHMHTKIFKNNPLIGPEGSLFIDYYVPEKVNSVPTGNAAFKTYIFRTEGDMDGILSPFHPQGGKMSSKFGKKEWIKCATQSNAKFVEIYTSATTVKAKSEATEPLKLYPFANFAYCIQNKTAGLVQLCLMQPFRF